MGKRTVHSFMRSLHRDIGYLLIGMTLIYVVSGIVLVYRDTGFLKSEKTIEKQLEPNLGADELSRALHMRRFRLEKTEGDVVYFGNGSYNKSTGLVVYSQNSLPVFLNKLNGLHKASSGSVTHWITVVYGVLLLFLAISSFWMFKAKSRYFKRGLVLSGLGLIIAILIVLI